jgi:signal transduction histidine kinase
MRKRVFMALFLCLLGTVIGAWLLAGGGVLRPLTKKLIESRADIVSTIADELEQSSHPQKRLRQLSKRLKVDSKLRKKKPKEIERFKKRIEKDSREIFIMHGRESPMMTPISVKEKQLYLVVTFPVDLAAPGKKISLGLLVLAVCASMAAWGLSRWSILPLEMANQAMNKITEGNLSHRVSEDIGETKHAFNQMADRVEALINGQRQLIAAISHELRTPLTRLRLQTELLSEQGVTESHLDRINDDINELDKLVEILLSSAKLDQGVVALKISEVNINDLIMDSISRVELGDRYIKLDVESNLIVVGDAHLLLRAVSNILSNISRYTPVDCSVEIKSYSKDKVVCLDISDTGAGVSDVFLPHIFLPFEREEKSRSKATGGLGLGLMLVKKVVEAHRGSVEALHNKPKGLMLRVRLPKKL